ncbi:hypothetical protein FALBO_15539 [Fusarium albosuccineum]|uniref:Uncharacterized protein n=1 Tax=Fusarium albosuccineum TaxID=1237068 RepID=A0A8H4KUF5_9HYPO|nr:hypothetical protein FALBO_15539 [Fusarium albosuccineum]
MRFTTTSLAVMLMASHGAVADFLIFSLYKDTTNGGWRMYDVNMNQIGTCDRPDPVQILTCPDVFSADNAPGIIHCSTALSIKGSN